MIESMITAVTRNITCLINGQPPDAVPTLNAMCLADFGDKGIAFVAKPQIPPRNVNWSSSGRWVHKAKVAFERYFLAKIRSGKSETVYERVGLRMLCLAKLKEIHTER